VKTARYGFPWRAEFYCADLLLPQRRKKRRKEKERLKGFIPPTLLGHHRSDRDLIAAEPAQDFHALAGKLLQQCLFAFKRIHRIAIDQNEMFSRVNA